MASPDVFQPTLPRILLALAVAVGGFFIPQEIPLEYYPLNNPSSGLQYLEITCAADSRFDVVVWMDSGQGFTEFESIRWPIDKSEMAFTYTFPLRDAPIRAIRLDPVDKGAGELTITNLRLINRREEEIRRFNREDLIPLRDIAAIAPLEKGWKISTPPEAVDPAIDLKLDGPIIAEGMNERNLKRSLLSWSYLSLMLWIILLAVYFALNQQTPWRAMLRPIAFLLFLSLIFSAVGNRGLIRNTITYARFAATLSK